MKKIFLSYYLLLAGFMIVHAIQVVFLSGLAITTSHTVAHLSYQKQELEEKIYQLERDLTGTQTLAAAQMQTDKYVAIELPIALTTVPRVASR